MSTQSLDLTVVGWIGTEVRIHHESDGGVPFTTFRLGSTRRWFDKQAGVWRDAQTEWFNVKVWRTTALNAARSLRKGDPVIVQGQLSTEEWVGADGPRTSLVLDASALGPNLAFGSSHFARTMSTTVARRATSAARRRLRARGAPRTTTRPVHARGGRGRGGTRTGRSPVIA